MLTRINVVGKDGKILPGRYLFDAFVNGVRHRKRVSACNKQQAQVLYDKWLNMIILGDRKYSFFDKLAEYLVFSKDHKSPKMFDAERRHVSLFKEYIPNMQLMDFKRHHAEDYIVRRRSGRLNGNKPLNNASINRDLSTLRYFFGWCIQREYYSGHNPVYKLHRSEKENERVVWLTDVQKQEIFEAASAFQHRFLCIALLTGMRRAEIATLRWEQVDLKNDLIQLFITKSKCPRTIRIPKALTEYLSGLRSKEPFVLHVINKDGKPVNAETLKSSWRRLRRMLSFKTANGSALRFHDLRHAYACDALMQGMSKEELQVQMGHSTVLMVEKYARYIGHIPHEKVDGMKIPISSKPMGLQKAMAT